jgi:hypothetical protein
MMSWLKDTQDPFILLYSRPNKRYCIPIILPKPLILRTPFYDIELGSLDPFSVDLMNSSV